MKNSENRELSACGYFVVKMPNDRELFSELCCTLKYFPISGCLRALKNEIIQQVSLLPKGGVLLGYDIYGYGYFEDETVPEYPDFEKETMSGLTCSVWCVDPKAELATHLNLHFNDYGPYSSELDASQVAALINRERLGEPTYYFPLALFSYPGI